MESRTRNYDAINWKEKSKGTWDALGRYQLTEKALEDVGMMKNGKWTGKYGIRSQVEFRDNPNNIQERILTEYLTKTEVYIKRKNLHQFIGKSITGIKAKFKLNKNNMLAAAHRRGAGMLSRYLQHLSNNGFKSDVSKFPTKYRQEFIEAETRLRLFENTQAEIKP